MMRELDVDQKLQSHKDYKANE